MFHEPVRPDTNVQPQRIERAGVGLLCEVRQTTRPWKRVRLEDLSPGGFRISWLPDVRAELPLKIRIPGIQLLNARICWMRDGAVGCAFSKPLHVAVFEHIVRNAGPI